MTLARVIEALLFSAHKPLSTKEIVDLLRNAGAEDDFSPNDFAKVRPAEVAAAIEQLKVEYIDGTRSLENFRSRGNSGPSAPLRNDRVLSRSFWSAQSRRIAKRRGAAHSSLAGRAAASTVRRSERSCCGNR